MADHRFPQGRKPGVLLINLGSPSSPHVPDVRRYLREFLSDGRVLAVPTPVRAALLNLVILPTRPRKSAEAYESIWTPEGSPLVVSTKKVAALLSEQVDVPVDIAMRYGDPSIKSGLEAMRARGVNDLLIVPLYPHYASSSYETVVARAIEVAAEVAPNMRLTFQPPFYDDPDYLDALAASIKPYLETEHDHILFSYHGIPESHVKRGDPSGCYCLKYEDCCARKHPAQAMCYRQHIHATTWGVADRLGIPKDRYTIAFQSRLAGEPWLKPYTDKELERFPSIGRKRIMVICPAFVSDCLETLEEINIRGREDFLEAGGKEFTYIPCLNEDPAWVNVLARFTRDFVAA